MAFIRCHWARADFFILLDHAAHRSGTLKRFRPGESFSRRQKFFAQAKVFCAGESFRIGENGEGSQDVRACVP